MKFKNEGTKELGFNDLGSEIKGVSPTARNVVLREGDEVYLPETGNVLLSAQKGDAKRYSDASELSVNDTVSLANAAVKTITHNFNYLPVVTVAILDTDWRVATTAEVEVRTNADLTETTVKNVSGATADFMIRIG